MIINEAMRSLRHDPVRAFFYWLTFALTTLFIFLFFSVSVTLGEETIVTGVTLFVIIISCINLFFANDFFVKAKAKEMAVRLVCGSTFNYLVGYLFIQTTFLLILAIPVGVGLTYAAIPMINSTLSLNAAISSESIINTVVMMTCIIFWIVLLNLSFTYKSAASMMLNSQGTLINGEGNTFKIGMIRPWMKKVFYLILFFGTPLLLYLDTDIPVIAPVIINAISVYGFLKTIVIPSIDRKIHVKDAMNAEKIAELGFFRNDIRVLKINMLLLGGSSMTLYSLLMMTEKGSMENLLIMISYLMMTVMLILALMFRLATVQAGRELHFNILSNTGFSEETERAIVRKETADIYLLIVLLSAYPFINIVLSQLLKGTIVISTALIGFSGFMIPAVICCIISYLYYNRFIFGKKGDEKRHSID